MKSIVLLLATGVLATGIGSLNAVLCSIAVRPVQASSTQQGAPVVEVKIENFSFGNGELRVPAGATVRWTNRDDIPHTVVSVDGLFESEALDTGDSFTYRFDKAGTYPYFCSLHPKMTGEVVVKQGR